MLFVECLLIMLVDNLKKVLDAGTNPETLIEGLGGLTKSRYTPDNVKNYEIEIGAEIINSNEIYKSDQEITQDKPDPPNAMEVGKVKYLLDEERRIFKNESHYFDHPKIGVIISVYDSSL